MFKLYFITITKQGIQLISIIHVGTDVCVRMVWCARKPTCLTWWPHDHLTCRRRVSNPGRGDESRVVQLPGVGCI